jgi:putative addiction module component (TIGR02574 family)
MSPLEKMRMDALKLSVRERAFLAKCLIDSLDQAEEQEIEQMWLDEAERRLAAYDKGVIPARPASEVFAEAYERSDEDTSLLLPAEEEMLEAAFYMSNDPECLGRDFLRKVQNAVDEIVQHPVRWPKVRGNIRRRMIHRFPYAVCMKTCLRRS